MNRSGVDLEQEFGTAIKDNPLKSKSIIITGAASGIGRAVALHLASLGCRLALTDLDLESGKAVCQEIRDAMKGKADVVFAGLDVSDDQSVGKLVRTFGKTYKRLDGLVNCAGINRPTVATHDIPSIEFFNTTFDINTRGTISFCRYFIKEIYSRLDERTPPEGGYSIV
jgi:NAD(P)-dependent dehydrogenase (short-subunit alcohol dehydrogenase family)